MDSYVQQNAALIKAFLNRDITSQMLDLTRADFGDGLDALRYENGDDIGVLLSHSQAPNILREVRQSKSMRGVTLFDFTANIMLLTGALNKAVIIAIPSFTRQRLENWYQLRWDKNVPLG